MDIEIVKMKLVTSWNKIANVDIRYGELILHCEIAYFVKDKKAWIRMPEKWITKEKKISYCYWPNREISDRFQKEVLKKIFDKYDLDEKKIGEMYKTEKEKLKSKTQEAINIAKKNLRNKHARKDEWMGNQYNAMRG